MNTQNGWIKLHRSILKWEWWDDCNVRNFFFYCLLKANHEDVRWHGDVIPRGSFITSLAKLAKGTGLSVQNIKTIISKLKLTGEITSQPTNDYRVITVCNYDKYQCDQQSNQQSDQQSDQQATNKRLTSDQQATNNKQEIEEEKEYKEKEDDDGARVCAREGACANAVAGAPQPAWQDVTADQSDRFHAEYRAELAGQTENAIRAQRLLKLPADEVVKLLDEYHDKQKLNGSVCTSRRDYRQHFILWAEKRVAAKQQKEQAANGGIRLGYDEWIDENGRRTYGTGKFTVPNDAPPRPSGKHVWVNSDKIWTIL